MPKGVVGQADQARAFLASQGVSFDSYIKQEKDADFINALNPEADERNEANTLILMPAPPLPGPVRVRQISGVLAKRIVCTAKDGDQLAIGQRYGMIKLGSRTEVCFPENPDWDIRVSMGQAVRAGITVLARLPMTRDER